MIDFNLLKNMNKLKKNKILFLVILGLPLLITSCDSGSSGSSSSSSSSSKSSSCMSTAKDDLESCLERRPESQWGICEKEYYSDIKYC